MLINTVFQRFFILNLDGEITNTKKQGIQKGIQENNIQIS